ncbi:MAG: HD domain-containing protein [Treponema sp.]|nr:HD domain-containing protein [Treponema sp.]
MSKEFIFKSDITDSDGLLNEFFQKNDYFTSEEKSQITRAWNLLVEKTKAIIRSNGEPSYMHPLRVANILAENKLDKETIVSALLHSALKYEVPEDVIKNEFGENTFKVIQTTNRILNIPMNSKTIHQSDAIRNMLFAMCDDVRIILITLADRLDRIRNIKHLDHEYQKVLAEGAIDIWAPLADRMGMQKEKNEFEDLSLKYTNPAVFQQIKAIVSQKKEERSIYLQNAVNNIYKQAEKMGIEVQIQSRAKHFYSIYQKMKKRNKEADELFDLLALRILCNTPSECYTLIGIVHGLWTPLDGRFKDYIAMPKANGYQSLHTTVMCEGKALEIQIRTHQMHNMAEHGIASHWLYKKGTNKDLVEEDKLDIFNRLQKFKENLLTDENSFSTLKNELLGDEIYVFTPKGDVKKLPAGANAIDFAYSIHSAIGEKIVGAKADGKIIPLTKPLQNTQIIEIITNPNAHPTETQLNSVKTSKAHQRIHSWLLSNDATFSEKMEAQKAAEKAESTLNDDQLLHQRKKRAKKNEVHPEGTKKTVITEILVQGERNVLYNFAQCCKPKYPDVIEGYVTKTKGISIHRADCLIYQRIPEKAKRSIQVEWKIKE